MTPSTPPHTSAERSRLRLVVVRVLVFSLFATLFARLYYLQVVSGASYHAAAASQSLREVVVQPQRGLIVDDQGRPLVANRTAWAVSVDRTLLDRLPAHDRDVVAEAGRHRRPHAAAAGDARPWSPAATPAASAAAAGTARRTNRCRSRSTYARRWRCGSSSSPRTIPRWSRSSRACAPTPARTA